MAKDPAFLFYPGDWMMGTMTYSLEEKGAYLELLILQFNKGAFPEKVVKNVLHENPNTWDTIKEKFVTDENGLFFNERLKEEKEKRKNFTESRRKNRSNADNNNVHVYLMINHMNGHIKIGSSNNPQRRVLEIQSQLRNDKIEILAYTDTVSQKIERELHKKYKDKCVQNEWFDLSDKDISNIISEYHMNLHMNTHMENENENENVIKTEVKKETKEQKTILFEKRTTELNADIGLNDADIKRFNLFWTASGEKDKKLHFEKQKTFDHKKRMATWKLNSRENYKAVSTYKPDHSLTVEEALERAKTMQK